MIYPIYVYGSSVLRKEAEELTPDFPELQQLIDDMFETMYASNGVGLAAPQIGRSIRLVVIDATIYEDEEPELAGFKKVIINPEIYQTADIEVAMGEGCLSLPGINEDVYRPETIRIRYMDRDFVEHDEEYSGYAARVLQHECDHLDGIVFTDHLSAIRKTLVRGKLNALTKGKFSAKYRTKQAK